ncbi:MAG TPA: hypothetical protein VMW09_03525 [Desulfatiglandales bacterium]|nr:hypothetical protein [Desulfatiglandales bacterium]
MPYDTEQELFNVAINSSFIEELSSSELSSKLIEPRGLFGIPDLLIANQEKEKDNDIRTTIIAFEMKLRNWKRALSQAFKYRAFANISYVVIDHDYSNAALKNIEKFKRSNIGLVSIDKEGQVYSHFMPSYDEPYCDYYKSYLSEVVGLSII